MSGPILLDGAMGTELAARGFALREPLFGAWALLDAPALVEAIHWDHLCAGAQVLTSNTFGLHVGTLAQAGLAAQQRELIERALACLAHVRRRAHAERPELTSFRIAGSLPPRPITPGDEPELARAEYRRFADALLDAGADVVLLETFTSVAEARLALEALHGVAQPVWLSVVAGMPVARSNRPDGSRLISGDTFTALAELLDDPQLRRPDLVALNCTQIDAVPAALDALLAAIPNLPLGLSPHLGKRRYDGVWIDHIVEPDIFAAQMHAWLAKRPRVRVAGACCGSVPDDIAAMRRVLQPHAATRERAQIELAQLVP